MRLLADRLLVKPFEVQEGEYEGKIHIPDSIARHDAHWKSKKGYAKPWKCRVVAVGPKVTDCQPGDYVLVSNYGKTEVECDPEGIGNMQVHFICREQTVMAKFENDKEF